MYSLFVYIHVVSAMASIGPFFLLFPLLGKMRKAEEQELHHYLPIFRFSVQLSKHAGHVLVGSGVMLLWLSGWAWIYSSWVQLTLAVMVGSLYFIARAFSPTLRQLKEPGHDRGSLMDILARSLYLYVILMLIMLWFMVAKPDYW